jgi:hypothetical protein
MSRTARAILAAAGLLTLVVAALIAVAGWRLWKAAQAAAAETRRIDALDRQAVLRPFRAPEGDIITEAQLSATLDVYCAGEAIHAARGYPLAEVERLDAQGKSDVGVSLSAIKAAFEGLRAQTMAMHRANIGYREYDYVRLAIAEIPWDGPDARPVAPGSTNRAAGAAAANAALFRRHRARIARCVPLADLRNQIDELRRVIRNGRRIEYDPDSGELPPIPLP